MSAISEAFKEDVQFVEDQEYQMLTIVRNVFKWKKIEMDARKLLTQEVRKQIFGMKGRNMDSKSVLEANKSHSKY